MNNLRVCKCQVTGERGRTSEFYKVRKGNKNLYYKDENTYLQMLRDKEIKEKLFDFIAIEVLGYDKKQFLPPFFLKQINQLSEIYSYEIILDTFKDNLDSIVYWMSQDGKFNNESNRLSYLMAIIKNRINDTYQKWKVQERQDKIDNITLDIDVDEIDYVYKVSNSGAKKKKNSISQFLD